MRLEIDWVSTAVLVATFIIAQLRMFSVTARYAVCAVGLLLVAFLRFRLGLHGFNGAVTAGAGLMALWYAARAVQARGR